MRWPPPPEGRRADLLLVLAALAGSAAVWAPFAGEMVAVYSVWDGPNYLTVARAGYDVQPSNPLLAYVHETTYFAVHLPVYPALVRALSFLGWQHALLLVSVASAAGAAVLFRRLCADVWKLPGAFWLALVFLFLPPRWLMFRSTGSTEATYALLAFGAILLFERGRTGWASLLGGLAGLTRTPGVLIAAAFAVVLLRRRRFRELPWTVLGAVPLTLYFAFWWTKTGNFFQYLVPHAEKAASFGPFAFLPELFRRGFYHQAEYYVLLALVYAVGTLRLKSTPALETPFWYALFQLALQVNVPVEDWSRYWLSFAPFALVLGYRDVVASRPFRILFAPYVLAALLYCWGTIPLQQAPREMYLHLLYHLDLKDELRPYLPARPSSPVPRKGGGAGDGRN